MEYMQARKALTLDSIDDKLEWVFCLFDSDGGGSVDLKEIEVWGIKLVLWQRSLICGII